MPVLLVLGGGPGSAVINETLHEIAPEITKQWFVVHVTGAQRASEALDNPMYRAENFLTTMMPHVMAAADVVVSRAGLGAISECAALGKPTVFIPLPQSHQEANAEMIREAKGGYCRASRMTTINVYQKYGMLFFLAEGRQR
jgi:UDP-N-acetylglucosamine--N-acetylmuramyl-(pentapeptide) pyrophosphoryl-undecaprenol N-acetylglucosamine transferase